MATAPSKTDSEDTATDVERPRRRKERFLREVWSMAIVLLVVLSARSSLADHYTVPTGSMLPTINLDDHIMVNKLAFGIRLPFTSLYLWQYDAPERGEVVVLTSPVSGITLVKRVVGLPGDEIEVRSGRVWLNGERVQVTERDGRQLEVLDRIPHVLNLSNGGGPPFGPTRIPDEHYLVLGDNRGNSEDGRSFGLVPFELLMGRAERIFWRGGPSWIRLDSVGE